MVHQNKMWFKVYKAFLLKQLRRAIRINKRKMTRRYGKNVEDVYLDRVRDRLLIIFFLYVDVVKHLASTFIS